MKCFYKIALCLLCAGCNAVSKQEILAYECRAKDHPHAVYLDIDYSNKLLIWGGEDIYKITHADKKSISAYYSHGRLGKFDSLVGGEIIVLNLDSGKLYSSSIRENEKNGQKEIVNRAIDNFLCSPRLKI